MATEEHNIKNKKVAVKKAQAKQGKVIAYKFKGKRFDCGNIDGYVNATNYFAKLQGII